jgi:probable addiction module antidote protein
MPKRTRDYHEFLLEQLTDPVFAASYLNEARQDSQKMFLKALRNVAESRRMAVVAVEAGVNRESLYKSLSEDGNPRLTTYDSILSALGLDYVIKPKQGTVFGSSEPSPETKEPEDVTSVRINFETGNTLQSAGLSLSNYIFVISAAPMSAGLATPSAYGVNPFGGLSIEPTKPDDNVPTPLEWAVIAQAQKSEQYLEA